MSASGQSSTLLRLLSEGFDGAVIAVVGGTGGIGTEVCRLATELGAKLVCASRSGRAPDGVAVDAALSLDVTSPTAIAAFRDAIAARYGRLDILVTTAGSSRQLPPKHIDLVTDALIDQVFRESAIAPLQLMRELAPLLRNGRDPVVVNVSSIAAVTGGGSNIAYAAAKGALDTAIRGMAKALAPEVRVVGVSPSALDTPFAQDRAQDFIDKTIAASALERLASPQEVAVAILCAARLMTATTGVTLVCDAGRQL